jgi:prepilin-type N-terminal cleavage/methylation domain-containing protein
MVLYLNRGRAAGWKTHSAFTLVEVLFSMTIIALMSVGLIYGYVQANNFAEWSSMSLSAQSIASQGAEQARAARWITYGNTPIDDLPVPATNTEIGSILVPGTGNSITVTDTVTVTSANIIPPLRQILSRCVWKFPLTGQWFTNTLVTCRTAN